SALFCKQEDGLRNWAASGVQTWAFPIFHEGVRLGVFVVMVPGPTMVPVVPLRHWGFARDGDRQPLAVMKMDRIQLVVGVVTAWRSEERRVGKECRTRRSRYHER